MCGALGSEPFCGENSHVTTTLFLLPQRNNCEGRMTLTVTGTSLTCPWRPPQRRAAPAPRSPASGRVPLPSCGPAPPPPRQTRQQAPVLALAVVSVAVVPPCPLSVPQEPPWAPWRRRTRPPLPTALPPPPSLPPTCYPTVTSTHRPPPRPSADRRPSTRASTPARHRPWRSCCCSRTPSPSRRASPMNRSLPTVL